MTRPLTPNLDHPAYHQPVKLRGYNGRVDVFRAVHPSDAARILRANKPDWTREDHERLAMRHKSESDRLSTLHIELLDQAHLATFGVARGVHDYRISAIGRDEYPEDLKERLRAAAHASTYHSRLHHAHVAAQRRAPRALLAS